MRLAKVSFVGRDMSKSSTRHCSRHRLASEIGLDGADRVSHGSGYWLKGLFVEGDTSRMAMRAYDGRYESATEPNDRLRQRDRYHGVNVGGVSDGGHVYDSSID